MKTTLKENLYGFCLELNEVKGIGNFSVIALDDCTVELHFNEKAFDIVTDENSRACKKFEKLLDKYNLEDDLIRYKCIEVSEK